MANNPVASQTELTKWRLFKTALPDALPSAKPGAF